MILAAVVKFAVIVTMLAAWAVVLNDPDDEGGCT